MSNKKIKRVLLLLVVFFLPFSFFYFFSLGSHSFNALPFLGKASADGKPFEYPDFSFNTADGGIVSKKDLKGKIVIATALQSGCPENCVIQAKELRFMVYKEISTNPKFSDVVLFSELQDTSKTTFADMHEKLGEVDTKRWIVYQAEKNPIWDIELNEHKLSETKDSDRNNVPVFPRTILLIDKDFHVRGFYDGSQTIEIKRLMDELRLLKKEYDE